MRNRIQYNKSRLGPQESNFFALVQMRCQQVIRPGDVAPVLGLTALQERDLFRRLARSGWIVRLRRGLYLAPLRLPAGGRWNPPESVVLPALMRECDGRYQICGPNAFNRYGFDEQVPNCVFCYNNRLSGSRQIGSTRYVFVRVALERLGAVERVKTPEGAALIYSSRTRTLVDALYDWSRFNGIPRSLEWIRQEVRKQHGVAVELARLARRFGNQATLRRLGYILQQLSVGQKPLGIIRKGLARSASVIALVPARPRKGPIGKEWGVIDNE